MLTCTLGEQGEVIPPELAHLDADHEDTLGDFRRDVVRRRSEHRLARRRERLHLVEGLLVAILVPLGPVVANVLPSRSGLAPDKETLARAGADESQAAVVRWLGAPFAIVEMAMLVTVCFPALAA